MCKTFNNGGVLTQEVE